ncbi:hypothetical protein EYF80_013123 [Liparis tanakae]|uniref:Uncharacterized protein n=1 Tax=Liparis tanakae TaxID=230148 RepID=A0A4Z2IFX7_9TELE|nr:hypothetical protein EYF80_013123 [Liparis tanakae]
METKVQQPQMSSQSSFIDVSVGGSAAQPASGGPPAAETRDEADTPSFICHLPVEGRVCESKRQPPVSPEVCSGSTSLPVTRSTGGYKNHSSPVTHQNQNKRSAKHQHAGGEDHHKETRI